MNPIQLSLFASRIAAVSDEMGAVLRRTAFSPNIKDRLDFSCAVFDPQGGLCAQAAHIPVHLGSMAYAMESLVRGCKWQPGDMVVLNDPFLGGTHLPDITLIAPVHVDGRCIGFVANRAHHADIGGEAPGSMPICSRLEQEGLVIPPTHLLRAGEVLDDCLDTILQHTADVTQSRGDFSAQISANRAGIRRLQRLVERMGVRPYAAALESLNAYGERISRTALASIPEGDYGFRDVLDDDGLGNHDLPIQVLIEVRSHGIRVDFQGSSGQVPGNVNCPLPVTAAAVYYVFRCLMPDYIPACAGSFRAIEIHAPPGSLLNAQRPAAVAAGNVETSSRVVDVMLGALAQAIPERIPAASQGTMNNLAMGSRTHGQVWDYYETLGGGMGGGPLHRGLDAVQTHMTNTLNTPIEVLESRFPLRVRRYQIRRGSGGRGRHAGGNGIVREFEFLAPAQVTLLTERRRHRPWGLQGGAAGAAGENRHNGKLLASKVCFHARAGDRLTLLTPGGGAWGRSVDGDEDAVR